MENSILNNKIDKILLEIISDNYRYLIKYIYNFFVKYDYVIYYINENKKIVIENNEIINDLSINNNNINIYIQNNLEK